MITENSYLKTTVNEVMIEAGLKIRDYVQLGKLRLSLTVVFSAGMSYLIAGDSPTNWGSFLAVLIGGLLVTVSANAINQILETSFDAQMKRTEKRPLPDQRMKEGEAIIFAIITCLIGFLTLSMGANFLSGVIALISHLLYSFVYTPLKRKSSIAVFVGAVPGALPVVIGWAAATNGVGIGAWALFAIQFFWQLPHFWAIAWVAYDDYTKAGYRLMPQGGERNQRSAIEIILYTLVLIPLSFVPEYFGIADTGATIVLASISFLYLLQTFFLYQKLSRKAALGLMFGSFLYLPVVLIALLIDKV